MCKMEKCKSCGAEIMWVDSAAGKLIPLDVESKVVMTPELFTGIYKPIFGKEPHYCPRVEKELEADENGKEKNS